MVHPVIEFPFCLNHFACTNSKGYYNAIRVSAKVRIVESWTKKSMAILFRIICNLFFQLTRNTIPSERVVSMSVCVMWGTVHDYLLWAIGYTCAQVTRLGYFLKSWETNDLS